MRKKLTSSNLHKLLTSPLGKLFDTQLFEWVKIRSINKEFKLTQISAVARATHHQGVDAFLEQLRLHNKIEPSVRDKLARALAAFGQEWQQCQTIIEEWETAFWQNNVRKRAPNTLVDLEIARRRRTERCLKPRRHFAFLVRDKRVAAIKFKIPAPAKVLARWSGEIHDPDQLYRLPSHLPAVESSQQILGPAGPEYLLRFTSPSPYLTGRAYARVYEPEQPAGHVPTLIYGSGLGVMNDQVTYWPEEEYIGRKLAAQGCRVILLESPWHGRREQPGFCSGEPYLAGAPESLFRLFATQAQDTAVLVQWARSTGAAIVGVGGVSLSGLVAQQVATHCQLWPAEMRPDMIFLAASSNNVCRVALESRLIQALGADRAGLKAGWDENSLNVIRPLLDPGPTLGLPADQIVAVLGRLDTIIPYKFSKKMLQSWQVPQENIVTWEVGHCGLLTRAIHSSELQELILRMLRRLHSPHSGPQICP